jgi:hypothetical protein
VAYEEKMSAAAHAEHEKSLFVRSLRFIVELDCEIIIEDRLGFLEGDAMLPEVRGGFGWIPIESDYLYIVWTTIASARIAQGRYFPTPECGIARWRRNTGSGMLATTLQSHRTCP